MTRPSFAFTQLNLRPFSTNCYILVCLETQASLIIDAPGEPERILRQLEGTIPKYILMTHGHHDHVIALNVLKRRLDIPVACHPADADELPLEPDMELGDGQAIAVGRIKVEVLHTPGHSPGSCCFLAGNHLFAGDTLFPGGPGWTAKPEDLRTLLDSLARKIFTLPDNTEIHPGHGEGTTIGRERSQYSAFISERRDSLPSGDVTWGTS